MISHLRSSFPAKVESKTVKKLGLAPQNESYVINALQFIGVIDEKGTPTEKAKAVFSKHKDEEFQEAFSDLVKDAYSELFDLRGDAAWGLSKEDLITFFRENDQTGAAIGARQAATFSVFAGLSGKSKMPISKKSGPPKPSKPNAKKASKKVTGGSGTSKIPNPENGGQSTKEKAIALTVRVEVNLPAGGDKTTYDNIFKSIKENLMDG